MTSRLVWAGLLLCLGTLAAQAKPILWTLSDVTLADGSSIIGNFTFDAATFVRITAPTDFQISISGGSVMPPLLYTPSNRLTSLYVELRSTPQGNIVQSVDAFGDRSPATPRLEFIFLVPNTPLSDDGGTIPLRLADSNAQLNNGEITIATVGVVSGFLIGTPAAAIPEPKSLFCLLSAAALLVWPRRRVLLRKRRFIDLGRSF